MKNVSIIIPAQNEEETLGLVLEDLNKVIDEMPNYRFEVICVDDHSTDGTANIARSYGAKVVENLRKPGKGTALRTGFEASQYETLVMLDADYSHRAEELPRMLNALTDGVGLVIGSRVVGGSEEYTHVRALGNVFLSATLGVCTRRYLSDALNGFKVFRREVFTGFKYTSNAFEIEIEIIANALRGGFRVVEVSSSERARAGGEMKSSVVKHGTRFLLRIFWEGLRGVKPVNLEEKKPSIKLRKIPVAETRSRK
ncbi:MAG: glycosyltransferase family 2 protein [Pyrinomonadaceae bacterium]|nr:glycosyltransferase family 2 protein [Pyrinomonadaceae bacterium]